MNIFVAGIHGVGKSYLASNTAKKQNFLHTSASELIKEQLNSPSWTLDKRASHIETNQKALIDAVKRHNHAGKRLLLDGHFVLLDSNEKMIKLESDVFAKLSLDGVILIENDPKIIADRIYKRDGRLTSILFIEKFMNEEKLQAYKVCASLNIKFISLYAPNIDIFSEALKSL